MKKQNLYILYILLEFMIISLCVLFFPVFSFAESICARVKIEIRQELTLERQAFDAHMAINNGLTNIGLENVDVDVKFTDKDGNIVRASSDPNDTSALFFIRIDSMENISNVDGSGTVQPSSTADIHWLIIPAPGSSNGLESGTLYYVGATLTYTLGGEQKVTEVSPDYIFVKPMPMLTLDYFLPNDVYGDDAFTTEIEPPIPFPLGVRVKNTGQGVAKSLKIDSAQPEIVENELGLLIGFMIEGSEVNGQPATNSLLVDFGDIKPNTSGTGSWIMTCTLSGKFIDFTATFTHSDELGGQLTSLIDAVNTHFLVHTVLVDLPGRDAIKDFLSKAGDIYTIYESDSVDTDVLNQSAYSNLQMSGMIGTLTTPVTAGFMYVQLPDPFSGQKIIKEIVRSDGKRIKTENAWLSKTRVKDNPWQHFINLFDVNTTDSYTVEFEDPSAGPQPPVLQFIPDKTRNEGEQLSFIVESSDPNGTIPMLSASPLPAGAKFTDKGNLGNGIATGIFDWTPAIGQAGRYEITFKASDGVLEDTQKVVITINSAQDADGDGIPVNIDNCPNVPNADQTDTDQDGVGDACDNCPNDPNKIVPGACGCGTADTDTDNDGVRDCVDTCPETPAGESVNEEGCSESQLNDPPIADAGVDRNALTGNNVTLDGSGSYDPDGDMITFLWSFIDVPSGSSVTNASLSDTTSAKPEFTPDVNGIYRLNLIVNDGTEDSLADEVIITSSESNVAPNADAGQDLNVLTGSMVNLNGSKNYDPDNGPQPLSYLWSFNLVPQLSLLTDSNIANRDKANASFTPDVDGAYELKLTVNDGGLQDEDILKVNASSTNAVPNADAGDDIRISMGETAVLDGSASSDPDNSPNSLLFNWNIMAVPLGSGISDTSLSGSNTVSTLFVPDKKGTYVLRLEVDDGQFSDADNVAVTADDDFDQDGYTVPDDCNDSDKTVNPGATEISNDGIDNDCNPATPINTASGSGYNYPGAPGFRASLSLSVNASSLGTSWLKYSYQRMIFSSTSITGLSVAANTATITGTGKVNNVAGCSFTATVTDTGEGVDLPPDSMGIVITPGGSCTTSYNVSSKTLSSGNYVVVGQ